MNASHYIRSIGCVAALCCCMSVSAGFLSVLTFGYLGKNQQPETIEEKKELLKDETVQETVESKPEQNAAELFKACTEQLAKGISTLESSEGPDCLMIKVHGSEKVCMPNVVFCNKCNESVEKRIKEFFGDEQYLLSFDSNETDIEKFLNNQSNAKIRQSLFFQASKDSFKNLKDVDNVAIDPVVKTSSLERWCAIIGAATSSKINWKQAKSKSKSWAQGFKHFLGNDNVSLFLGSYMGSRTSELTPDCIAGMVCYEKDTAYIFYVNSLVKDLQGDFNARCAMITQCLKVVQDKPEIKNIVGLSTSQSEQAFIALGFKKTQTVNNCLRNK